MFGIDVVFLGCLFTLLILLSSIIREVVEVAADFNLVHSAQISGDMLCWFLMASSIHVQVDLASTVQVHLDAAFLLGETYLLVTYGSKCIKVAIFFLF